MFFRTDTGKDEFPVPILLLYIFFFCFLGSSWPLRAKEGQGQQGHHRVQHNVHRRAVPEILARALEVPQDGRQQVVRVHARDTRGSSGKSRKCSFY
jgi:hypothetical protein